MAGFGDEIGIWCPSADTQGASTLLEQQGSGLDGTLVASPQWVVNTENSGSLALEFDGSNHVDLDVAKGILDGQTSWTVGVWYKPTSLSFGNSSPFGDSLASFNCFPTHRIRTSDRQFFAGDGSEFWLSKTIAGTPPATWQHIVLGYDGDLVTVHSQGSLAATFDVGNSKTVVATSLRLAGGGSTSARRFVGLIDDFRVWDSYVAADIASVWYANGRGYLLGQTESIVPQLLLRRRRMSGGLVI